MKMMMKMMKVMRRMLYAGLLSLACLPMCAWAGDQDTSFSPSSAQTPQGIEQAPGPVPAQPNALIYQTIAPSMLPAPTVQVTAIPGQPAPLPAPTNLGGSVTTLGPYTLGRDDVISVSVSGQPDFSGTFVIGPDGKIQYPYVGDISAEGLTKDELRDVLTEQLKKFVRVPSVQVMIVGFNSKAVYIVGAVSRPGKYSMRGDTVKVRDALIAAGLLTDDAALSRVRVIKTDPKTPKRRLANLKQVLYVGKLKDNIDLVNEDVIVVPWTAWSRVKKFFSGIVSPAVGIGTTAAAL